MSSARRSSTPSTATIRKVLARFGEGVAREVMKLVEDFDGDTFRAAYVVSFPRAVYVLHVFKKKSSSGRSTPRPDKATIRVRFEAAKQHHRRTYDQGE
jgi:phage-related protein